MILIAKMLREYHPRSPDRFLQSRYVPGRHRGQKWEVFVVPPTRQKIAGLGANDPNPSIAMLLPLRINVVAQNLLRGAVQKRVGKSRTFTIRVMGRSAGFSAAKILKINSATIVRRIERLEQVIGYRLFVRHTDGVSVTAEGRMIMEHARTIEGATFNIIRQSQISHKGIRGLVRGLP